MLGSWPANLMSASAVICVALIAANERRTGLAHLLWVRLCRHRYPALASVAVLAVALIAFLVSLGPSGCVTSWSPLPGWVAVAALAVLVMILDARAERLLAWQGVRSGMNSGGRPLVASSGQESVDGDQA